MVLDVNPSDFKDIVSNTVSTVFFDRGVFMYLNEDNSLDYKKIKKIENLKVPKKFLTLKNFLVYSFSSTDSFDGGLIVINYHTGETAIVSAYSIGRKQDYSVVSNSIILKNAINSVFSLVKSDDMYRDYASTKVFYTNSTVDEISLFIPFYNQWRMQTIGILQNIVFTAVHSITGTISVGDFNLFNIFDTFNFEFKLNVQQTFRIRELNQIEKVAEYLLVETTIQLLNRLKGFNINDYLDYNFKALFNFVKNQVRLKFIDTLPLVVDARLSSKALIDYEKLINIYIKERDLL